MSTETDEIAALDARALELEREITRRQKRLASLVGLPGAVASSEIPALLRVGASVSLPPLTSARAHAELFRALHEETGIVGAVRTEDDRMEWRTLDRASAGRTLEVDLEAGAEGAMLRVRDGIGGPLSLTERIGVMAVPLAPAMFSILPLLRLSRAWPTSLTLGLLLVFTLMVPLLSSYSWSRWRTRKALEALAARLADRLPRGNAPAVRVGPDVASMETHEEAADELHERRVRRAVP